MGSTLDGVGGRHGYFPAEVWIRLGDWIWKRSGRGEKNVVSLPTSLAGVRKTRIIKNRKI